MRFFIDTEFIESGPSKPIQLISIGMVCENGKELYLVSSDFNATDASQWVSENVLLHLGDEDRYPLIAIAEQIRIFVKNCCMAEALEFWGYYSDYDWVVFCQIFGSMMDLPDGWPMYCRDLKQLSDELGVSSLPTQDSTEHNALNDARWNLKAYQYLRGSAVSAS